MNKKIPVIIVVIVAVVLGVSLTYSMNQTDDIDVLYDDDPDNDDQTKKSHDYVWSGPLGVTQYEHRLGEDVFIVMRGLGSNEKGTVGIFTPQGVLFRSFEYDGSLKSDFNYYFYPDTFAFIDICTPEELVGIWKIVFANNAYPTLEFKMSGEYVQGGEASITTVC